MTLRGALEGVCPYALAFANEIVADTSAEAAILTTTCDQMRRAGDLIARQSDIPVFLMNIPATWQSSASRRLYRSELERLGRFLVDVGGKAASLKKLAQTMMERGNSAKNSSYHNCHALDSLKCAGLTALSRGIQKRRQAAALQRIPIALIGGPLPADERWLIAAIEEAGGRIVLDGTDNGERTMPGQFERKRIKIDPMTELVRAYFETIPDIFQRPNTRLYEWLADAVLELGVKGIIIRNYIWCDLWRGEVQRIEERTKLPVLHIDTEGGTHSKERTMSRVQSFFEMLNVSCGSNEDGSTGTVRPTVRATGRARRSAEPRTLLQRGVIS